MLAGDDPEPADGGRSRQHAAPDIRHKFGIGMLELESVAGKNSRCESARGMGGKETAARVAASPFRFGRIGSERQWAWMDSQRLAVNGERRRKGKNFRINDEI